MTIDWWTLGLQAVNVLILVWLLSRVFWRPLAQAIAARQDAARKILDEASATRDKAEAALAEVTATRSNIAQERSALLAEASRKAEAAAKAAMEEAAQKAETLVKLAQAERARENETLRARTRADAARLAVDIARKLLGRVNAGAAQTAFLLPLVDAIAQMSEKDRAALAATAVGIDLVGAVDLDDATKAQVSEAVGQALGSAARLTFRTDPDLIAGFELRTPHFVLRDSWQADLEAILKDLKHAA